MSKIQMYEQKRASLFKLSYVLAVVACIITVLCFAVLTAASALVGVILTSAIYSFVKDVKDFMPSLTEDGNNENSVIHLVTLLTAIFVLGCIACSGLSFSQESFMPLLYIAAAVVTRVVTGYMHQRFFIQKYQAVWQEERAKFLLEEAKTDLRMAYTSTSYVLSKQLATENMHLYDNALKSNNLEQLQKTLSYFKSLKEVDVYYRQIAGE